ncbi:adenosylcobinamide-GDP ribazoletransferase [Methylomonas sp. DH-1]|uniref:adenosylcobinamide-GDP ribazoletransferase n=1 Tax=Methylomonas sp. (strain DH-1) TaxID=1727196 RepID=UPI0007C8A76E|nr:adenosylcobinamide-GDP ribazoletransferase [Methylomonas sp. DH-1]ANE54028.1 cobalamin synthase [Methylomonas sp. DH-1]
MQAFWLALQFLTRIPVPDAGPAAPRRLGQSALYYPAVGLLLGLLLALLAAALAGGPHLATAALVLAAWVLVTGGLHLDGLADCADAWVGGYGDRERSLRIMKDPSSGPIAVCVLLLLLLLKFAAIEAMLAEQRYAPLLVAPVLGRAAILLLMCSTAYVNPHGLAAKLLEQFPADAARWPIAVSAVLGWAVLGWSALLAAGLVLVWLRRSAIARLGGCTGDVYGAAVELVETAVITAAAFQ